MEAPGPYDGALQMFAEDPRDADVRRLEFLRWLAERGMLDHAVTGPPRGRYSVAMPEASGGGVSPYPRARQHRNGDVS